MDYGFTVGTRMGSAPGAGLVVPVPVGVPEPVGDGLPVGDPELLGVGDAFGGWTKMITGDPDGSVVLPTGLCDQTVPGGTISDVGAAVVLTVTLKP